jgi:excisionase family DNA binding protein
MSVTDLDLKRLEEKLDLVMALLRSMKSSETGPRAFTMKEAAARLSISETTLKERVRTQEIPSIKIGRSRRIPASAIERLLQPAEPKTRPLRKRVASDWRDEAAKLEAIIAAKKRR